MPTIEKVTIEYEGKIAVEPCFNVSKSVGIGGRNEFGDVMLIQALFLYLAFDQFSVLSANELSEPNGVFDTKTVLAIRKYQAGNYVALMKEDGLIHPASYQNRTLRKAHGLMTITKIHFDSKYSDVKMTYQRMNTVADLPKAVRKYAATFYEAAGIFDMNYTQNLLHLFPQLKPHIKYL